MTRVLVLACLGALFLGQSPAWAEDPVPPPPPPPLEAAPADVLPPAPPPAPTPASEPAPADFPPPPLPTTTTEGGTLDAGAPLLPLPGAVATPEMFLRAASPAATETVRSPWSGVVRLRYRLEATGDDTDNDLFGYLRANYRSEDLPGLSGSFHGRLSLDLDDFGNQDGFYVFDSVADTYEHRLNGKVYHLFATWRFAGGPLGFARAGRQYVDVGEYLTFDGVQAETAPLGPAKFGVGAFAGVPTYLFESSPDGNFLGGARLFAEPWSGGQVELDWTYVQDDTDSYGSLEDSLFNLVWNQRIGRTSLVRLNYQHLDEPRLLRATFDVAVDSADLVFRGYFHTLFNPQAQLVYDFDAFYVAELDLEPYWEANLSASKGLCDWLDVEGGFSVRRLYEESDEGIYNRQFEELFLGLGSYDWLLRGLALSLTGEWWNSDDDVWTATFDVEYRPSRCWRFQVGTDYAAYRYDIYADAERDDVYGVYVRAQWRPSPRWTFDARLRVEEDDYDTYTTLDASAQFNF